MTSVNNESISASASPVTLEFPERLRHRRLMLVTESLGPTNGVTRATISLLNYLQQNEVEVVAIAPYYDQPDSLATTTNVPIHWLKGFPLPYNPELRIVYPFRLKKLYQTKNLQPELMYLASPASLGGLVWLQSRQLAAPKMIANFQTDLAAYARTILPWGVNRVGGLAMDWIHRTSLNHPNIRKVLYPSQASRDYLEKIGLKPSKLVYVGRGVDTVLFNPAKRNEEFRQKIAPNGETILLCVSRLSLEKGYDFLARFAHRLFAEPVHAKLVITGGNNNPSIEKSIKGLFGELADKQVIFTGPKHGEELSEVYASADIFVYSSLTETFGQVIQEAMASALPVIARKQGGPADLVIPGETGFLPEPNDLDDFVAKVKFLLDHPETRQEYAANARHRAERATWDAVNNQIAHLLVDNCL